MRTKYLDRVSAAGLPGPARVRVALDVLEHCARISAASAGSSGPRPMVGDVVVDANGAATVSRAGKPAQLVTLLWEILAGKPSPSEETPWSDPATDLPDDAMGALASLSMRPPASASDLSKRFAAIAGATAASRAEVAALFRGGEAEPDAAARGPEASTASSRRRDGEAPSPSREAPARTPVVPSGTGSATIPVPAVKVKELLGLSKEDLAPALADATVLPEALDMSEPPRARAPRPVRASEIPSRESAPAKTPFARVLLVKGQRAETGAKSASSVEAEPEARVSSSPPPGRARGAIRPPDAGSSGATESPAPPSVSSGFKESIASIGPSSSAPSSAVSMEPSPPPAEPHRAIDAVGASEVAGPSVPRASTAPRAVVATGLAFAEPAMDVARASAPPPRRSVPPRRDAPSRASLADLSRIPGASESTYTDAEISASESAAGKRPWLLSGLAIGLVVLIGLWGWGRTRPQPTEEPPPAAGEAEPSRDVALPDDREEHRPADASSSSEPTARADHGAEIVSPPSPHVGLTPPSFGGAPLSSPPPSRGTAPPAPSAPAPSPAVAASAPPAASASPSPPSPPSPSAPAPAAAPPAAATPPKPPPADPAPPPPPPAAPAPVNPTDL